MRRLLLLLTTLLYGCLLQATPRDTVELWKGCKVRHAKEVSMLVYQPEKPSGVSVIVCPGGSYHWLDRQIEGREVGQWLSERGITAFVLFYRTVGIPEYIAHTRIIFRGKRHPDMITDAQRALQWVWENARSYGIDPGKIGMMGFSAGGHLVMSAACYSKTRFLEATGVRTEAPLRPAFVVPVYPVVTMQKPYVHKRSRRGLLGDNRQHSRILMDSLSLERHIPADCPPVFLVNCIDDPVVQFQNSVLLDSALTVRGIPHRYLQYETGGHGFGVNENRGSSRSRQWKDEFLGWLKGLYPEITAD